MEGSLTVCLLADDMRYAFSLHSLLTASNPRARFHLCRSERETAQFLSGVGIYRDRQLYPLPNVLLLDAHHPEAHDLFVLSWIRMHPQLHKMPILVLAESGESQRVDRVYDLGANACIVARKDLNAISEILDGIYEMKALFQFAEEPEAPESTPEQSSTGVR